MRTIAAALDFLASQSDIAGYLATENCQMSKSRQYKEGKCSTCPVAMYLAKNIDHPFVEVGCFTVWGYASEPGQRGPLGEWTQAVETVRLPDNIVEFIGRFDNDQHPELVIP